jgi:hypothetical protein
MSGAVRLYERTEALAILDDILAELEGELTPEAEQLLSEAMADFDAKVEAVAAKIRELEAFAGAADTEAKRITALGKSAQSQADSLTRYLLVNLQRANVPKVHTPRFKVSVRENPPKCEALLIAPEKLQELRAQLVAQVSEFPELLDGDETTSASIMVSKDEEQLAVETARPAALTQADMDLLDACVIVTPEQVIPESRAWDKKALIAMHKTHPATVAAVAQITRGTRLDIK